MEHKTKLQKDMWQMMMETQNAMNELRPYVDKYEFLEGKLEKLKKAYEDMMDRQGE